MGLVLFEMQALAEEEILLEPLANHEASVARGLLAEGGTRPKRRSLNAPRLCQRLLCELRHHSRQHLCAFCRHCL